MELLMTDETISMCESMLDSIESKEDAESFILMSVPFNEELMLIISTVKKDSAKEKPDYEMEKFETPFYFYFLDEQEYKKIG